MEENKEKTIKIIEIAEEIANNFTSMDIWIASTNNMRKPEIIAFIYEKYHAFLSDIDEILIRAKKLSSLEGSFEKIDGALREENLQELNDKLRENKEENYIYVISASDFTTRIYTLSGAYREFKDAEEHLFDGFNGDIRLIRSEALYSINIWIYLIEITTTDIGKTKYIVKIEKILLK